MANVFCIETNKYLRSVNTPEYESENYLINPSVPECDEKYWKAVDGEVAEMSTVEKTVVDSLIAKDATDAQNNLLRALSEQGE